MPPLLRLLILGCFLLLSSCQKNQTLVEQNILSFGTLIDITIATTNEKKQRAHQAINEARELLNARHHQWHAWQDGELSTLNKTLSDHPSAIKSEDLKVLITRSKHYYQASNGLFNPAMGLLIKAWGFHGDEKPNISLINQIKKNIPTMDHITIKQHAISSSNPHAQLDFGGIAKGLAIEQIQAIFAQHGFHHYLINIGGDLNIKGTKYGQPWRAGIQNPFSSGAIATISLSDNNLFTSGNYQRFKKYNKKIIHHIINPRTGEPSQQANAVTVLHKNPLSADVAATALMIAPPEEWQTISQQLGVKDYLLITEKQNIWVTPSLFEKLTFNTELKVHIIKQQ